MPKITYQYEPLLNRPSPKTRKRAQFKAGFSRTLDLLERELGFLSARNIAIQADVERGDIRLDGMLRADAKPRSPAIALSFDSRHGPLTYPCDTYLSWQDNLRAIALALEALRAVDRYGVTRKGEQYSGWARLPGPAASNGRMMDKDQALAELCRVVGGRHLVVGMEAAFREAEMLTHPDKGGNADDFKRVQEARKALCDG